MSLRTSYKIQTLANDLGLRTPKDPVRAVLKYCENRILGFLREFPDCRTLTELLEVSAAKLDTTFAEIHSDEDLEEVRRRYSQQGEMGFVGLHEELSDNTFGITLKRLRKKPWERQFVSVIDFRGDKRFRSYFTKWHELGHLLVLTDQMRLSFRRTHVSSESKDPEEVLVDIIAGRVGFLPHLVRPRACGVPSFCKMEDLRSELCPEASREASRIGFVKAWPTACLLLKVELGLKRGQRRALLQQSFEFQPEPRPALRAVQVSPSVLARKTDLIVYPNMRVPERSVLYRMFSNPTSDTAVTEAIENLSWWEASGGFRLPERKVRVQACSTSNSVYALITPFGDHQ